MNFYSLRQIVVGIIGAMHLGFLLLLFFQPHFTPKKKEHKTLIVKTITPKPLHSKSIAKNPTPSHPQPKPPSAPKTTPQKTLAKKDLPKTTTPSKKSVESIPVKKTEPAIADKTLTKEKKTTPPKPLTEKRGKISDSLLKELEESIAKIEQKADKKSKAEKPEKHSPLSLQIDNAYPDSADSEEGSYIEILVGHLRQTLQLPDYGEVKIQLSLRQDGSVVKIVILRAKSQENKRYLEENLPYIRFPRFEGALASQKESSFTLTFENER